jgi:hypothetical protein
VGDPRQGVDGNVNRSAFHLSDIFGVQMPPPQPLHEPHEIQNMLKDSTPLFVMTATHPKPEHPPSVPRVALREVEAPLPGRLPDRSVNRATPANKEAALLPSRGVLFASVAVLLSGGLVIYLVWSRRKHGHL